MDIKIGEKIREARLNAGLSQTDLAKKVNMKQTHIARYETNVRVPNLTTLIEIARATKKKPGWFLNDL